MREQQAIVIGLGQFGFALARALAHRRVEVLAVDLREDRVRAASSFVAEAACLDATDADALAKTMPARRDLCICAIGDESRDASIVCTALLRQMGAPQVIARANDDLHARILTLVGAHKVVNPEREFGERFASQVLHRGIIDIMHLGSDLVISEVRAPSAFIGRTLGELALPRRFGVTVVALRRGDQAAITTPDPKTSIAEDDVMVLVAKESAVAAMIERS
ncbi:MAG: TrkA family potassium uptake protein [Nannocystis sp.]|nr:TrkA family potassium uptake protein [Nannocystis sp.]